MRRLFQLLLACVLATQSVWVAASDICHHAPGAQAQERHTHHEKESSHHLAQSTDDGAQASPDGQSDCGVCHLAHLTMNLVEFASFEALGVKGEVPKSVSAGATPTLLYSIDRPNWSS